MASKYDYYTLLSRAVAGLDRDAFAARGSVYDREHKALLRRLFSPASALTDAEIDEEQWAFRDAIRRIEFGEEPETAPSIARRPVVAELAEPLPPPAIPLTAPGRDWVEPAEPPRPPARRIDWSQRRATPDQATMAPSPSSAATIADVEADRSEAEPSVGILAQKPSVAGRVMRRTLLALVLVSLGIGGYGYMSGQIKLPWLAKIVSDRVPAGKAAGASRAVLYDGELSERKEDQAVGSAVWRAMLERVGEGGSPVAVLALDAEVPQRKLALRFSMRPEAPGGTMSHLIQLRFLKPGGQPDEDIADLGSVLTRTGSTAGRTNLPGSMIKVAPGVFLFGLDGQPSARQMTVRQLDEMQWLDLPLTYRNGATGVLAIEVGDRDRKVIADVLAKWTR
jgi:hypothetical protein